MPDDLGAQPSGEERKFRVSFDAHITNGPGTSKHSFQRDREKPAYKSAREITLGLEGHWIASAGKGKAKCPAHDDRKPSLEIDEDGGKPLVWCGAGCSQYAVITALTKRGFWFDNGERREYEPPARPSGKQADKRPIIPVPPDAPPMSFKLPELGGYPVAKWAYHEFTGALVGYIARWNVRGDKTFLPITFCELANNERAWRSKGIPEPRPLYRLPRLVKRTDRPIIVVEGEKAADAAQRLFDDYAVTTAMHGAKSPGKTDWSPVSGRNVVIWPDNDPPGMAYAETVMALCEAAGAMSVTIVTLPDRLPSGWDLADPLPGGMSVDDLRGLLGEKPPPPADVQALVLEIGSDVEIARRVGENLTREFGQIIHTEGSFWRYGATHWEAIPHHEMRVAIHKYDGLEFRNGKSSSAVRLGKQRIDSVLNEAAAILTKPGFFSAAYVGINCASGFIQFRSDGKAYIEPHNREHRCRHTLAARWVPGTKGDHPPSGSLLRRLLDGVFLGDDDADEKQQFLSEVAGAAISAHATKIRSPKAVIFKGQSANGKSQILDAFAVCYLKAP